MGGYGAVTGLVNWGKRLQKLPQQALDTVGRIGAPIEHGVEAGAQMLGIPLGQPQQQPNPYMAPIQDVEAAQPVARRMMPKGK